MGRPFALQPVNPSLFLNPSGLRSIANSKIAVALAFHLVGVNTDSDAQIKR